MKPKTTVEYLVEGKHGRKWGLYGSYKSTSSANRGFDFFAPLKNGGPLRIIKLTTTTQVKRDVVRFRSEVKE